MFDVAVDEPYVSNTDSATAPATASTAVLSVNSTRRPSESFAPQLPSPPCTCLGTILRP